MQGFKYTALQRPGNIRLLQLHWGKDNEPLSAEVMEVPLSNQLNHTALSYVWGKPILDREICTPNGKIDITTPLHHALRCVHQNGASLVWADAVCINQKDNIEKAQQVGLAREIYKLAKCVFAFLGEEADSSHLIPDILKQISAIDLDGYLYPSTPLLQPDPSKHPFLSLPDQDDPVWSAVRAFFRRPWWRRVWILQEFVVAQQLKFACGGWTLDSETVESAIVKGHSGSLRMMWDDGQGVDSPTLPRYRAAIQMILKRKNYRKGHIFPLHQEIGSNSEFEATLSRDLIFALSGLTSDAVGDPAFQPDYEDTLEHIVTRFAITFMSRDQPINVLLNAGSVREPGRFPSWVPNWIHPKNYICPSVRYSIDDEASCQPQFDESNSTLTLKGSRFDEISQVGQRVFCIQDGLGCGNVHWNLRDKLAEVDRMLQVLPGYPTGESLIGAAWHAMTAHQSHQSMDPEAFEQGYREYRTWIEQSRQSSHGAKPSATVEAIPEQHQEFFKLVEGYPNPNPLRGSPPFSFCTTRKGYVGIVPPGTQVGDVLCFFRGERIPFVIRHCTADTHQYFLVGSCWIHGADSLGSFLIHGNDGIDRGQLLQKARVEGDEIILR